MWVTIAIALLFVSLIWSLTGRRKGLPPGPTCYPIIGNVGLFKPSEAVQGHRRLRKIYGDFYSMMIFHKPMIIVHGYQNIRELLGKHGDMFSERPKGFASEVITKGKGLIWSSGPLWKEQRTFALTTMRKFGFGRRCMESQIIEEGFVKEMIEEHKRNFDEDNINDYIDTYLLEQKQRSNEVDTTFTDEQLNYSVQDFFAAGTETTSTTLRWALLYLIHHQDWQKGLQNDIDDVIGQGQPKMEHKDKLPRVEAFILEVQRLGNLVPINLPHAPKEDFTYNGHLFPKGAIVFCVLDSVMMDPDIFPEPSEFKPERFLDPSGKCSGEQKDSMVPFATGRRACLGESLAKMELFLFLTRFLQTFDVKPENPNCLPSLDSTLGITNMPLPFNVVLNKR
ncbi:cytochrome P450 2U1-like isoform X3 [Ostrea edulis]|uniref:cytochrome P450 2U1-like isoform X3 n=1 Tax=Ostrea edulis TaxID=37623 RepID=UPI0024AFFEC8|nr:cytochrome P450 2U1-like isoform X3 [Ostrea edulis]